MDRLYAQAQMVIKTLAGMTAMKEIPLLSFDPVETVSLIDGTAGLK